MRYRSVGNAPASIEIRRSVVVGNDYHFRNIGAAKLDHRCLVVKDVLAANEYLHRTDSVTIVDTRPEAISESISTLREVWRVRPIVKISILVPARNLFSVLGYLRRQPFSDELALVQFAQEDAHVHLTFAEAEESDRPFEDFMDGYRLGQLPNRETFPNIVEECAKCELTQRQLLSALMAIEALNSSAGNTVEDTRSERSEVTSLEGELARIKRENENLSVRLEAQERRYAALSSSNLGKATLRYWSWRRRGGRG